MKGNDTSNKIIKIVSISLLVIFIIIFLISLFIITHTTVHGISMQSTLDDGDVILINKAAYVLNDPERYDIVLFKAPCGDYYIKRIIGIPGDTIQIKSDGNVYINDMRLDPDYGLEPISDPGNASDKITLEENEYFMLGDDRNFSTDSRDSSVGIIAKDDIIGKAFYRIGPFDRFGAIDNEANAKYKEYIEDK